MSTTARAKQVNRAEVVDNNFLEHVRGLRRENLQTPPASSLNRGDLLELFDSQMASRQLDLMARVKRLENKVFYTIGSSGHEGNAMVGRLTRATDPAFLHYRSGAFMAERSRFDPDTDFMRDTALSFAAARQDPASGGRHKVWGSRPLWVVPQTSTIASHLPKAVGTALAIAHAPRIGHRLPVPGDSLVVCSFGDASVNHSTALGAFNTAQWATHQKLPLPILFVCEDNAWGISVRTPAHWIEAAFSDRPGLHYVQADGCDLAAGWDTVSEAVAHCRERRRPVFLHLRTTRLMGHAGTDFEVDYRDPGDLERAEARDPLLRSAELVVATGLMTPEAIVKRYEALRRRSLDTVEAAHELPKLESVEQIVAPLAPASATAMQRRAAAGATPERRQEVFGETLPEVRGARHLAILINWALTDLLAQYPEALVFGEDVAQKGGVYTVTRGLFKRFGGARVFNTLLDEQTILGLAQGYGLQGYLPIPEIQYLAYFHNACDQIRGEACSQQFFSEGRFRNPMLLRLASLGYQKGFGGHFHNDNSITALRDIPGLLVGCPSRGDDAATMLRTMAAMARVDGRVCAFLEPIALYMTKDLHADGDGQWQCEYPPPGEYLDPGEPRIYHDDADELVVITYGNGVPMALRAARTLAEQDSIGARVVDLRWLQPLNTEVIAAHAGACKRVLVLDEGRQSAGVGEGVITAIQEAGLGARPLRRVAGADSYIPLAGAAELVLPSVAEVVEAARALVAR